MISISACEPWKLITEDQMPTESIANLYNFYNLNHRQSKSSSRSFDTHITVYKTLCLSRLDSRRLKKWKRFACIDTGSHISTWAKTNNLRLNTSKSKELIIY